jgi:hypothetical protein
MNLQELYDLAKSTKSLTEFKSAVSKIMDGTPETVVTNSTFLLINTEKSLYLYRQNNINNKKK